LKSKEVYKFAVEGFGLAVSVFLLCSCISFNMADAPSEYVWPHNQPAENWCGSIGAFCAYYMLYFIGPGVFILLLTMAWAFFVHLLGNKVDQVILRGVGLLLLVAAMSTSWFFVWGDRTIWPYHTGIFPMGGGGILGIAIGSALQQHFAALGTTILLASTWFVGFLVLADTMILSVFHTFGRTVAWTLGMAEPAYAAARKQTQGSIGQIWKRLNERQREQFPGPMTMKADGDEHLEQSVAVERLNREPVRPLGEVVRERREKEQERYRQQAEQARVAQATQNAQKESVETPAPQETRAESPVEKVRPQADEKPAEKKPQPMKMRASEAKIKPYIPATYDDYTLPPIELLREPEFGFAAVQEKMVEGKAKILEELLAEFGINAHVVNAEPGPAITMYELELAPGIKVSQIANLSNDMARALSAGSVRVVAPLQGRHTIGIEVPNSQRETVRIKDLIQRGGARVGKMHIPLFLGKTSSGEALVSDLAGMPHLLIAGTTGSGKSVCINTIITSVLMTRRPDEIKMILIDPKMVEMAMFESLPHLMCPVVTEVKRAEQILEWATTTMDERYELLSEAKVRNLASYNLLTPEEIVERFQPSTPEEEAKIPKKLPHIVIIIDELADLMMTSAKEVEAYIVRIAQKSRAVGIHLIIATQRPQATVVTGLIKANMPTRIGFRVAARMDSRIILDQNGAETLLGQGDMLFLKPGTSELERAQGAYLDDQEIGAVVDYLKTVAQPQYHPDLMQLNQIDMSGACRDDLFDQAVEVVLETKRGSVSLLQRRLGVGYARASRMIEMMAQAGILGEYKGSQAREVTMTAEDWQQIKSNMIADEVAGYADLTEDTGGSHEGETAGGEANESKSDDDEDDSAGQEDGEEIGEDEDGSSDFDDEPSSKRRVPNSR
jgi:S-DNA-T family DNA segregation ATPase FtsK/SpoIIIE